MRAFFMTSADFHAMLSQRKGNPMQKFILHYYMTTPPAYQAEGAALQQKWQEWMHTHATNLIEPQNPFSNKKRVSKSGTSDADGAPMGYSILQAETLEAAINIVQSCPFMDMGHMDVCQIMDMQAQN
jgi:hypothetical protein